MTLPTQVNPDSTITLLDSVPFKPDVEGLRETLRLRPGSSQAEEFDRFLEQARSIARPKVVYKVAFIEEKTDSFVIVDGVQLTSRVLRVNLDSVHRVFPYVATCGEELDDWQETFDDFLYRFWIDAIKAEALGAAFQAFDDSVNALYQPGPLSGMNPGSLEDWPLSQQFPLFSLLGDVEKAVGVRLTETCLMLPNKSVSGILFPTDTTFQSCQLCPREICPNRRAPYDSELYASKYERTASD